MLHPAINSMFKVHFLKLVFYQAITLTQRVQIALLTLLCTYQQGYNIQQVRLLALTHQQAFCQL
jgi:hypothetical protein